MSIIQSQVAANQLGYVGFVAADNTRNGNTLTIPAGARGGDIAVVAECINTVTANLTAPSGWTLILQTFLNNNVGGLAYYKILTDSDAGATLTSTDASTTNHFMVGQVFRANNNIRTVSIGDTAGEATTGDPTLQTLNLSGLTVPVIGFFHMAQRGSNNVAFSLTTTPTNDGATTVVSITAEPLERLYYKIYNITETPADLTGDIGDAGAQLLQSWYIQLA